MAVGEPIEAFRGAKLDAAIIGAGPAGAAVALALKRSGIESVAMIDWPRRRRFAVGESAAPGIGILLEHLGLDCRLERLGHRPCHGNLSFWGGVAPRAADYFSRASGPGWHLDRAAFDGWLRDQARDAGARFLAPARLLEARRDGQAWRLQLGADAAAIELSARWVLDATGRGAAVSRRLGARLHRVDHLLALAVIGRPAGEARFRGFTVVEATEIGWWYGARLPDGRAMMALMTDADIARRNGLRAAAAFHQAWSATIEMRRFAAPVSVAEGPAVFSAATQFLDRAAGPGWLALGDALMALDPLSASGLTGALEDALAAGEVIAGSLSGGDSERRLAAGYARRARATLESFLTARLGVYAAERRWHESLFWRRRIAGSEILGYHAPQQEEFAA
ncbi:MAG TPA: FAD-dependent monooxygenase [Candidatus Udaeobacter sp.]|nr:FAD-dependent monooxygenase [Candidatus Udaeobacter sp.]